MKNSFNHIPSGQFSLCTGCGACVNICPYSALSMKMGRNGFLYPYILKSKCQKCGACETVCPSTHLLPDSPIRPTIIAAKNKDWQIRRRSSSGGAFYELSRYIIEKGGVVFGVRFDGLHVIHDYTESLDGIEEFMGSKYIQSDTRYSFQNVRHFLSDDRYVLYSGTPCQIAGLKLYLRKDYNKLLTVEVLCHGVPSPGIWEKYMNSRLHSLAAKDIKGISFRDKKMGMFTHFLFFILAKDNQWKEVRERISENAYCSLFLRHIFRPSCYDCKFRTLNSYSDFSIGDNWNSSEDHPKLYDGKGISTIIAHTIKAQHLLEEIITQFNHEYEDISIMKKRFSEYIDEALNDKQKRQWKLFYLIQPYISLEKSKFIWGHDKPFVIIKRKLKYQWGKNIK